MLTVDQARVRILSAASPLPVEEMPLADAVGMVLAEDLRAPHALPRFDNSAMDGYAVRKADVRDAGTTPVTLIVTGEVRAGAGGSPAVEPGTAVRIMTGAPVPPGADAVVPVEDTSEADGRVEVSAAPPAHGHIRPAGDDLQEGDLLVPAGLELGAGELALLASMGCSSLSVHRRPNVAILTTGDELVDPSQQPGPGQIRDSNSLALRALVAEAGGIPYAVGPVPDDEDAVQLALEDAASRAELIVSSGGVSMGRYDFVRKVIKSSGQLDLWRVAMQPGKPVVSGSFSGVPFLGLPGNPVSIHVGFEQFVRPFLRKLRGCSSLLRPTLLARISQRIEKRPGRLHFVRVRLSFEDGDVVASPIGAQGSHIQSSLVDCHGVARFDMDATVLEPGDPVVVELWRLP